MWVVGRAGREAANEHGAAAESAGQKQNQIRVAAVALYKL